MQEEEDVLVDYNDPLTPSHTPPQTPLNLNSDSEGEEGEDKRQEEAAKRALEEGRKADEDSLARTAKRLQEYQTLQRVLDSRRSLRLTDRVRAL